MTKLNIAPEPRKGRLNRFRPRRRHLRALKRVKPSRRHVRTTLMATAPAAAMFGFAGMQPGSAPAAVPASMSAPLRAPEATPAAVEASYYGKGFAGRPTANGETFDPGKLTAAHRTLPFGSIVRVTDAVTGKSVDVRINDRGPFHGNREIDLSKAAAREIGMLGAGTAKVVLETIRSG
jgi:rare lipoprotein A (peptidoglycan hydrolase)